MTTFQALLRALADVEGVPESVSVYRAPGADWAVAVLRRVVDGRVLAVSVTLDVSETEDVAAELVAKAVRKLREDSP
jgi:hypothetical protein